MRTAHWRRPNPKRATEASLEDDTEPVGKGMEALWDAAQLRWFIAANKKCTNGFCGCPHSQCRPEESTGLNMEQFGHAVHVVFPEYHLLWKQLGRAKLISEDGIHAITLNKN